MFRSLVFFALLGPAVAQAVPRARLEGQTTDAVGRPLANCAVTVEVDGDVVAKTSSDATGSFAIADVEQRRVVVRATAAADVGAVQVDLAGIDAGFARVPVYPARTLRGVVKGANGAPIAGAWIVAAPNDERELAVIDACVQSGADGHYELTRVLAGPVTLRAWAPGRELFEADAAGAVDVAIDCTLGDEPGREIRFALHGATAAQLAAASLQLTGRSGRNLAMPLPPPLRRQQPGPDGVCVVRGWSGERLTGRFVVPGAAVVPPFETAPRGPGTWQCDFAVDSIAASGVMGVLRDLDDKPVAGKLLLCRPLDDDLAAIATVFGCTSADGTFALPAPVEPRQRFALRVVDPDRVVVDERSRADGSRSWFVAAHQPETRHEVQVDHAVPLQLRAVDAAGKPVRGVEAVLRQLGGPRTPPVLGSGSSDANGRVEWHGIDLNMVARIQIDLRASEGVAVSERGFDGKDGELGTVTLAPAATFAGRVVDAAGNPLVGARVRLDDELVLTGRDGRFAVTGLHAGTHRYTAGGAVGRPSRGEVKLEAGATANLELVR